jgi:hypothetical protein
MSIKYKYLINEAGQVVSLGFAPPDYVLEDGWKVGDCDVDDRLPDINTLHEQKYLDAQALIQYKEDRRAEYPPTGDQLDMIYKDNLNSTTTHKDAVEVVKTKWPKDNSGPV